MKLLCKYFFDAIRLFPGFFLISLLLCLLSAVCTSIIPLSLQVLLDAISNNTENLYITIIIIIIILLLSILIEIYKYISLDKIGGKYISNLLEKLESTLLNMDEFNLDGIHKNKIGHILYSDVLDVFRTIGNYLPNIITSIIISVSLFIISIFINNKIAYFLLFADFVSIFISYCARTRIRNNSSKTNLIIKKLHLLINDFVDSLFFIKTNNLENYYVSNTKKYVNEFILSSMNEDKIIYLFGGIMNKSVLLLQIIFSSLLALLITNNINNILIYTLIFSLAINESSKIESYIRQINKSFISFKNIDNILSVITNSELYEINNIKKIEIYIDSFKYNNNSETLLNNLNIELNKGDTVLLSGNNGSGKSTLIKLLTRIVDSYQGKITINDIDILKIKHNFLYDNILYISQNDYFINGTIFEYLSTTCHRRIITRNIVNDIFNYLEIDLNMDDVIDVFGRNLSGGQKKKLQLARIILSKDYTSFFIIDEIDAGLDTKTIKIYEQLINDLTDKRDKIIIVIQHSNSQIKYNKHIHLSQNLH